ncbi:ATP synthase F1, gamma subunit [Streptococcus agalactiae H36B]|nr:ATP synthase F1, gamma subunit [Streptococcus agalactiae H36B]
MQMVSSAKLVKSEQAARDFQVYASKIRQITTNLLKSDLVSGSDNPMLSSRPVKKTGYIVITSDKGLVGGYNSKILKAMMDTITDYHTENDELCHHFNLVVLVLIFFQKGQPWGN